MILIRLLVPSSSGRGKEANPERFILADFPSRFLSLHKNKLNLSLMADFFDKDNSVFGFKELIPTLIDNFVLSKFKPYPAYEY